MGRGDGEGRWRWGKWEGGDEEGQKEGGDGEVGKGEVENKGQEDRGISQMDMKCLGGHMECLCGTRLQSFLTLFTRATPGTPASLYK